MAQSSSLPGPSVLMDGGGGGLVPFDAQSQTITVQSPGELGSGLDSMFSRLSYPTLSPRSGGNPPPSGLTRGGRYPQQPSALSPLSWPAGILDDDDLFDMDM